MIKNKKSNSKYAADLLDEAIRRKELYDKLAKKELIPWNNQF